MLLFFLSNTDAKLVYWNPLAFLWIRECIDMYDICVVGSFFMTRLSHCMYTERCVVYGHVFAFLYSIVCQVFLYLCLRVEVL